MPSTEPECGWNATSMRLGEAIDKDYQAAFNDREEASLSPSYLIK